MDFQELFRLGDDFKHGAFRASPEEEIDGWAVAKGLCEPPKRFNHFMGSRLYDLIGTGRAVFDLVSQRLIAVLRDDDFTGWQSYPADVYGKKGEPIDGYEVLIITGRCGPIQWEKGTKTRKPPPVPQGQGYDAWVGMYFDPVSWDGSDLFMPEDMTTNIITEPVKTALVKAKITNVSFEALTEFERSWPL